MPGVIIRTATRSGPVNPAIPDSGKYLIVGQFERGLVGEAVRVRSAAELEVAFGPRVPYSAAWDDLRTFFEEGGSEAWVVRVAGPAATTGTLTVNDTAGVPTLKLDAKSPGAWSADVKVTFEAGYLPGTTRVIVTDGRVTEKYESMASPAVAAAQITAKSTLVTATDLGSATAAPGNLPAVAAAAALSAGADDRASIVAKTMTDALAKLGKDLGTGAVAIPGYPVEQVGEALMAHAKANRRIALLATGVGATPEAAQNAADAFIGTDGEYAGLFFPWARIPLGGGVTKLISPEGFVAAMRARAHREEGPWRAPAGDGAQARFVVAPERVITADEGDKLNEGHVNCIRTILGTTRLYGWRSLSTDTENYRLLIGRDVVNTVAMLAEFRLEPFVFHSIDGKGHLMSQVKAALVGIVAPYAAAGGLYPGPPGPDGMPVDPGWAVDVGATVNTAALLAENKLAAQISLRISPVAEFIDLTIVKAALAASVS